MPNAVSKPLHFVKQNTLNLTRFIRNEINTKNSKVLERSFNPLHFVRQNTLNITKEYLETNSIKKF